jgi:hypothetical protein
MNKLGFKSEAGRLPRAWRAALRRRGGWSEETKAYLKKVITSGGKTNSKDWSAIIDKIEDTYREAYKNHTPMTRTDLFKQCGLNLVNKSNNTVPMPKGMQSELDRRGGWAPDVQQIRKVWGHTQTPHGYWREKVEGIFDILRFAAQDNTPIDVPDILELVGLPRSDRWPASISQTVRKLGGWPPEIVYVKRKDWPRMGRNYKIQGHTNADTRRSDDETTE